MTDNNNNNNTEEKTHWPELVGMTAADAKAAIEAETSGKLSVYIVEPDSMVTCDYRLDRVRIFEDKDHKVTQEPRIG